MITTNYCPKCHAQLTVTATPVISDTIGVPMIDITIKCSHCKFVVLAGVSLRDTIKRALARAEKEQP
jgi:hypothetical protein